MFVKCTWSMSVIRWYFILRLWICYVGCIAQSEPRPEEVDLFNSVKQTNLKWTSNPLKAAWHEVPLKMGSETEVPVYQACAVNNKPRSLLTKWIDRKDAYDLLLDIVFAQEEESSTQWSPLQIHLLESDVPLSTFRGGQEVFALRASRAFHDTTEVDKIEDYLNHNLGLHMGGLSRSGFHLGFSYSGPCVFIASVRLYYRKCPGFVSDLVGFGGASAESGLQTGSCVEKSVEVSPPKRQCTKNGVWGPMQGQCVCAPGHQEVGDSCQACRTGFYKPTNESGGCHPCPPNSRTDGEGSEECDCIDGYFRLLSDPYHYGCTRPPSAPVNVVAQRLNDSMLTLLWDSPHDLGGRQELIYDVECEIGGETAGQWEACGEDVIFLPASSGLTITAVNLTGVNPRADYRLSVRASNALSDQHGAKAASVASTNIQRWKALVKNTPAPILLDPNLSTVEQDGPSLWVIVGGLLGGLLLLALVPVVVCTLHRKYIRLSQDQEVVFLPIQSGVTYRRNGEPHSVPQEPDDVPGAVQLLEGLSDRLLTSLKDVFVDYNKLTLGKELGSGEFGLVYKGIYTPQEGTDITVAVKTMRVGIHSQEDLESFLKEAEIMQQFDHDNVIKLLGVTLKREQDSPLPVPLVILPFMKHGDLRRFLIATRYGDIPIFVPHQSLLRFMIDIAAGMEYLSSQGFLHRDLAARNCMLRDDLHVCVADFGLSKKIYSSNYYKQKVAIRMPFKWMAIESLSESIYTNKTDVWSFGVTMWEIASWGRTPYAGVHNYELLELLESGHRLKPPECDGDKFHEVMLSCWHREPTQRPGFRELGERLKALLSELPPLDASQEAHYINQGLEAAYQGGADGHDPEFDGCVAGNVYLPTPAGATAKPPPKEEEEEEEEGYLLCIKSGLKA